VHVNTVEARMDCPSEVPTASPCQHLCKWQNTGTKSQWPRDSFSSKVLLSIEIDALAARTPECSMRDLENGTRSIIAFGEDFGSLVER
jgi:hypothetical protein